MADKYLATFHGEYIAEEKYREFARRSGEVLCLHPHAGLITETCPMCGASV